MMENQSFESKLLTINIHLIPLIFFDVMRGMPLPFGKGSCGLPKRQKWGIGGRLEMG
jgi:hypothetical protein